MTGSGTLLDPFIIWDVTDLQNMNLDLTAYYELGQDIDASAVNFTPIGVNFTGSFDGQGHKISKLSIVISAAGFQYGGLFDTNRGIVKDVKLEDVAMSITATTFGSAFCGALVAINENVIDKCSCTGSINSIGATWAYSGGLVCVNDGGAVSNSYALVTVSSVAPSAAAGGFVDDNDLGGTIDKCFAKGNVSANGTLRAYTAGFCRDSFNGSISDCYSTGNATSITAPVNRDAGGFVKDNDVNGVISNCYSLGIPSALNTGGFAEFNNGIIGNCFWDINTSGLAVSAGGTGLTTAEMVYGEEFAAAGWSQNIWGLDRGRYPCLIGVSPSCVYAPIPYPPWPPVPPPPLPPPIIVTAEVSTLPATNIAENHATLNGVLTNSLAKYGEVRFQYGVTSAYGMNTPWQDGFFTGDNFYANITDVGEGAAYHFRAQFRGSPIVSGSDMTFSTLSSLGPVTMVSEELMQLLEG